jgi:hypothetical protein
METEMQDLTTHCILCRNGQRVALDCHSRNRRAGGSRSNFGGARLNVLAKGQSSRCSQESLSPS